MPPTSWHLTSFKLNINYKVKCLYGLKDLIDDKMNGCCFEEDGYYYFVGRTKHFFIGN